MMQAIHRRLSAILIGWLLAATALAAPSTFGTHGMALFGNHEGLYAAHLPMFHGPHDYQLILQFHVADAGLDATLRNRLEGKPMLWTIDPEKFELDRLAPNSPTPLRHFKADLVLGHFEHDGKVQYSDVTLVVDKVLMYRQLAPAVRVNPVASYVRIGEGRQRFLVKEIDSRPDFDHIVAYRSDSETRPVRIHVAKPHLGEPSPAALANALGLPRKAILGTVYYYTDDLR
ncbi:hypothetical protein [Massilia sp. erpn]|uniref:hypothetical protein n=1 Tax=Massilia sp. erpn TaxID=2738142 RepID=UPI002104518C|nr:hypothetical protein [Massilia sp. erpn]